MATTKKPPTSQALTFEITVDKFIVRGLAQDLVNDLSHHLYIKFGSYLHSVTWQVSIIMTGLIGLFLRELWPSKCTQNHNNLLNHFCYDKIRKT